VQVEASKPLPVTGQVKTESASDRADRVILIGWEERAVRDAARPLETFNADRYGSGAGLPVRLPK
jgi:hypothetical protein